MLEFKISIWELTLLVSGIVLSYYFAKDLVKIVTRIIFTNKFVMKWNIKRQTEQRKLIQKTELQKLEEGISLLEQFIEWVTKHIPHNQHKQFWRDFSDSKETRTYWIKTLKDIIQQRKELLKKEEN